MTDKQMPIHTDTFYRSAIEGRLQLDRMERAEVCARAFNATQLFQAIILRALRTLARPDSPVRQWLHNEFRGRLNFEPQLQSTLFTDGLLDANQVAQILGVPKDYVYRLSRDGRLPTVVVGGRYRRFRKEDVRRWIEENEE